MKCPCFSLDNEDELTETEKVNAVKLYGPNVYDDKVFFEKIDKRQAEYLMSIVDMQDCQHSYSYAKYVKQLENRLNTLKK